MGLYAAVLLSLLSPSRACCQCLLGVGRGAAALPRVGTPRRNPSCPLQVRPIRAAVVGFLDEGRQGDASQLQQEDPPRVVQRGSHKLSRLLRHQIRGAKAYMLIEDVTRGCPETAQKSVKAVAKAFGQSFSKECRDMIFHVHRKVTWGRPRRRSPGPLGHPHLVPRGTSGHERLGALGDTSALRLGTCWIIAGRRFAVLICLTRGPRSILVWMKKKNV